MTADQDKNVDAAESKAEALILKNQGNEAFKKNAWVQAVNCYSKAIQVYRDEDAEKAVLYKNRAAAFLKLEKYQKAIDDCSVALEIFPTDPKALFRRCTALESMGRVEEAYRDARLAMTSDPTNKALQQILARLHEAAQEKIKENAKTAVKVEQMFNYAFDITADQEKRETAMNNLVVLARENAGLEVMLKNGVVSRITRMLKNEKNKELYMAGVRIIGEICRSSEKRTKDILSEVGLPWFLDIMNCSDNERVSAAQYCLQTILNSLSGLTIKPDSKPNKELCEENKAQIDSFLTFLSVSTTCRTISGEARDAIIELITRNVHYSALDWGERFVEIGGLQRLLEVASELKEYRYESAIPITDNTCTLASVCIGRIYENMYYDEARKRFFENVDEFVKEKLISPDIESKVRVTVTITTLLSGALDVGNTLVARSGIMEMILVMAGSDDVLQQKVACECIIAASSKKDKVKSIIDQGVNILKKLYMSKNDAIRVRALVGLCKLGSSGGTDASVRPFADGSTVKLAEACRRFLVNPAKDPDMRRWAAEGLSYLTLDADVKEQFIDDRNSLHALLDLAKTGSQASIYGIVTTLVNLVNAYDKNEVLPEMMELARFAKHHIPEEHELDDPDFVAKRVEILAKEGVTSALVSLARTESHNCRELIGRVFNALCGQQEHRGLISQQGGAKALLNLTNEGTDKGKRQAAQALARIGITINPEVAFPGQRCLEVIRPLVSLLNYDCSALETFEALMALCNLAGVSESIRKRIVKEQGIQKIETYMYEDHEMLRRAATQCMVNLLVSSEVVNMFEGENDRTKFLVLMCCEEDEDTHLAAAGALAILLSSSEKCSTKVFEVESWSESLRFLIASPRKDVQHRGLVILACLLASSKDNATKIIETDLLELLMAISQLEENASDPNNVKVKALAMECLKKAESWKLIQKPDLNNTAAPSEVIDHQDLDEMPELMDSEDME